MMHKMEEQGRERSNAARAGFDELREGVRSILTAIEGLRKAFNENFGGLQAISKNLVVGQGANTAAIERLLIRLESRESAVDKKWTRAHAEREAIATNAAKEREIIKDDIKIIKE